MQFRISLNLAKISVTFSAPEVMSQGRESTSAIRRTLRHRLRVLARIHGSKRRPLVALIHISHLRPQEDKYKSKRQRNQSKVFLIKI